MRLAGRPRSDARVERVVGSGAVGRPAETSGGERGPVRARGRAALLLAVSTLLLSFDLGRWVLATNDETRFPMLARDILAQGHWWLPRLNGVAHLNKPPLYAWLIAVAAWPTGAVTQRTAAYPSVLAALGAVGATYWIGRRLFSREVALAAGLIVVTTYGVFTMARVPMPDMMFCFALTGAMAAFVAAEFDGRRWALALLYGMVAVAFWTKGPAALLALAVALGYTWATHGWAGAARRLALAPGLFLLVLVVLPWWLIDAAAGGGEFTQRIVLDDWLLWYFPAGTWSWRAVTDPIGQALTILLPWASLLPFAVWSALRAGGRESPRALRLLLIWTATVFFLIAISRQQRMRYYLPLCPPAELLIAAWCSGLTMAWRRVAFVSGWAVVALGLCLWQVHAGARHNEATDLQAIAREISPSPKPLYTFDVPELVLAFYLERPVVLLPDSARLQSFLAEGRSAYLVIADRAVPRELSSRLDRVGGGRVNGRPLSLFNN
jgi:4-amino-4-deoxy-L-arabinose transferase-like glycosyltransferase